MYIKQVPITFRVSNKYFKVIKVFKFSFDAVVTFAHNHLLGDGLLLGMPEFIVI